ncbi:MAG: hypothetical protein JO291_08370 [Acidimicrobiia bacterium]|nr:hypothetical protein [Acidimicrobiia bacterium]
MRVGTLGVAVVVVVATLLVAAPTADSAPAPTPVLRIDAGGPGVAGSPSWQADSATAPNPLGNGALVGASQVRTASGPVSLAHPSVPAGTPEAVFRTARSDWRSPDPSLHWTLPSGASQARVRLYFAELDDTVQKGGRVFDVLVEGQLVDDNLDVVARTGGVRRALVRTYAVAVTGGAVDIQLRWQKKPPMIAAVELLESAAPPPPDVVPVVRVDAGGAGEDGAPVWEPDTASTPNRRSDAKAVGPAVTTTTASVDTSSSSLPADTPPGLFSTVRTDQNTALPNLAYVLPVDRPGTYVVRLYFVEVNPVWVGKQSRVQDVIVDGRVVDDDLDVAARGGGALKGFARSYVVSTSQQAIQIELRAVRHATAIAALELLAPPGSLPDRPGSWTEPVAGAPRLGEDGVVALDGYLYRAGGQIFVSYNSVISTDQHDRYDPRTGAWTSLPPLPEPVDHLQAVTYGGKLWYLGGMTGGPGTGIARGPSDEVVSYDPATGQIESHNPMPRPRGAGGVAALDGRICYFGGLVTPQRSTAQADVYDIATDTWSELPDMPVAKDHFKAVVIGTDIHLPGGRPGVAALPMVRHDVFDTVTGTYRTAADLPVPMGGLGAVLYDGRMVVAGGETRGPDAARRDVFAYDPTTDGWTALEPMHVERHGIDLAVCGNAIYAIGGMGNFGAANAHDTGEVFTTDGSAPDCPLTAPAAARVRTGAPSVLDPEPPPSARRLVGTGSYCSL